MFAFNKIVTYKFLTKYQTIHTTLPTKLGRLQRGLKAVVLQLKVVNTICSCEA